MNVVAKWPGWAPQILSVTRIVAGAIFVVNGMSMLFAIPYGVPPNGGTVEWVSQAGLGGLLQLVGGAFALVGLFTRPVAFVLSGMMAVAYFQFHAPQSFWPGQNGGLPAILFCFLWLYLSAAGAGPWSLDAQRGA